MSTYDVDAPIAAEVLAAARAVRHEADAALRQLGELQRAAGFGRLARFKRSRPVPRGVGNLIAETTK
jgi:hypothetical protein